jgi:hypothetical protein
VKYKLEVHLVNEDDTSKFHILELVIDKANLSSELFDGGAEPKVIKGDILPDNAYHLSR